MEERWVLLSHVRQLLMMMMMVVVMMGVRVNVRVNDGGGRCGHGVGGPGRGWQRRLRLNRVARRRGRQARVPVPVPGTGPTGVTVVCTVLMRMAKDDPREGHGSLMMLSRTVRVVRLRDHVVARGLRVTSARMMMTTGGRVMISVVRAAVVIVILLLPLAVLLVLHPPVLEPDLHLALGQVQVARQLPPLLLGHVRVVEELLLELEGLELGVRLAFLPHRHLPGPIHVRAPAADAYPRDPNANADRSPGQGTWRKQRRWGGTPHHWRWVRAGGDGLRCPVIP